jgi:hypothetical protein
MPERTRPAALQPLDTEKVKIIGRLVEQQDIGQRGQSAGEGGAACLATGQPGRVFFARETEFFEQIQRPVATIGRLGAKPRLDIS